MYLFSVLIFLVNIRMFLKTSLFFDHFSVGYISEPPGTEGSIQVCRISCQLEYKWMPLFKPFLYLTFVSLLKNVHVIVINKQHEFCVVVEQQKILSNRDGYLRGFSCARNTFIHSRELINTFT